MWRLQIHRFGDLTVCSQSIGFHFYESITGLPENPSFDEFENLLRHVALFKYQFLPITYLCAFLKSPDEVFLLHQKLLLSSYERDMALFLLHYKAETRNIDNLRYV